MAARKRGSVTKRTVTLSGVAMGAAIFAEVFPLLVAGLEAMEIDFTITATNPWTVEITYEYDPEDYAE